MKNVTRILVILLALASLVSMAVAQSRNGRNVVGMNYQTGIRISTPRERSPGGATSGSSNPLRSRPAPSSLTPDSIAEGSPFNGRTRRSATERRTSSSV
jgi:hypothetical protein